MDLFLIVGDFVEVINSILVDVWIVFVEKRELVVKLLE